MPEEPNPELPPLPVSVIQWMPIETAPKDGTFYLAASGRRYAVLNEPPGCVRGQWHLLEGEWRGESDAFQPTHWQPLPPPPVE